MPDSKAINPLFFYALPAFPFRHSDMMIISTPSLPPTPSPFNQSEVCLSEASIHAMNGPFKLFLSIRCCPFVGALTNRQFISALSIYYHLDIAPHFHVISYSSTGWMNWPINEFHISKLKWQILQFQHIHVYPISITIGFKKF